MSGFWSRLLGRAGKRPVITQELSADAERLNDVVDWFLTNEDAVRRHQSTVLHGLLLLGYAAYGRSGAGAEMVYRDGIEFLGLRNQTTFYIWRQLAAIRLPDGTIEEEKMKALLQRSADHLRDTVIHLREYDTTGGELVQLLRLMEPIVVEFVQQPNPMDAIPAFRAALERAVFNSQRRRHLGAVFVSKSCAEIVFYVLCWLYYSWYGRQFYSPPLP